MSLTIPVEEIVSKSTSPLLACSPDWERRRLGDVSNIVNGAAFSSGAFSKLSGKPLIRIRDITKDSTSTNYTGEYEPKYLVRPGELLVGMDGDFKSHVWQGPEALLNQRVCKIVPDERELLLGFLAKILPGYLRAIHQVTSSMTVTHLSSRDLANLPIPVPPLPEQKRIMANLEELSEQLGRSQSEVYTAKSLLSTVRASVLAAACRGSLTKSWRDNHPGIEPAHAMVQEIRSQRGKSRGRTSNSVPESLAMDTDLPETWVETTIGHLIDVATGATPLRRESKYYGGDVPWVTSGAVNKGLIISADEAITPIALRETNAKVFPAGTLLVAMYGEGQTRGRVAELGIDAATNQAVAALIFDDENRFLRPYLRVFFEYNYSRLRAQSAGGVQENLNLTLIRSLPIAVPPLQEQVEILEQVRALTSELDRIEEQVESAVRALMRVDDGLVASALKGEMLLVSESP